ncbi:hypothetical protein Lal_00017521 [Lupinus albus]|nr:hypothetical protein Lal_00017521 [Lupinus albus]
MSHLHYYPSSRRFIIKSCSRLLHDLIIPTTLSAVDQEGNKNKLEVTTTKSMYASKEPFERSEAAHMRKLGPGEKKLTKHEETSMISTSKSDKGAYGGKSSKISGATYSDGICDYERERDHKNVKCKGYKSSKPKKFKMDGFVAFTEDYHGPRHHLPKHN